MFEVGRVNETGIPIDPVENFLNRLADEHLENLNPEDYDDYHEFEDFRIIEFYGNDKYVLRSAFNDFHNDQVDSHEINYITFLTNKDIYFLAAGTLDRFDNEFYDKFERSLHTDCRQENLDPEKDEVCFEVEEMLMILTTVHLTTFANPSQLNQRISGK